MKYTYKFNKPQDMIDLAQKVQTAVYWGYDYYEKGNDDESFSYKYFWEACDEALSRGCTGVEIEEKYKYVTFIK